MSDNEDLVKKLREAGMISREDLQDVIGQFKTPEQQAKAENILDHLNNCKDDNCEIHQFKSGLETDNFMLGFLSRDLVG